MRVIMKGNPRSDQKVKLQSRDQLLSSLLHFLLMIRDAIAKSIGADLRLPRGGGEDRPPVR